MTDHPDPLTDAERTEFHARAVDLLRESVRLMEQAAQISRRLAADDELRARTGNVHPIRPPRMRPPKDDEGETP